VGERDLRGVKSINILLTDMGVIHTVIGQVSTFYTTKNIRRKLCADS
jgi:hypothetical protein